MRYFLKFTIMIKNIITLLFILLAGISYAQKEKKFIREGNKQYKNSAYRAAEEAYQKALNVDTNSFAAGYNLGNAFYKQKNYDKAEQRYINLINSTKDKSELSKLYHNLGNSQLYSSKTDIDSGKVDAAMNKVSSAVKAYKNSLKLNPSDKETKYNLSYAQQLLKNLQNQKNNSDNKKDQDKKDKDKKDQEDKKDQNQDKNQDKNQKNNQQISKEDAERMLEALKNDEKKVQEKVKKQKAINKVKKEKDW